MTSGAAPPSQAILGLQFAPASKDKLRIVSVRKQARAGERVQFRVFGLAPSESACLQVKGDFLRVKGKKSGDKIVRKLQLPAGNQRRVGAGEDLGRRGAYVAPRPQLTPPAPPVRTTQHHRFGPASTELIRGAGPKCVRDRAPGLRFAGRTRPGRHHTRPSWGKPVRNRR